MKTWVKGGISGALIGFVAILIWLFYDLGGRVTTILPSELVLMIVYYGIIASIFGFLIGIFVSHIFKETEKRVLKGLSIWLKGGIILAGLYVAINILMIILGYASGGEGLLGFAITSSFPIVFLFHGLWPEVGPYAMVGAFRNMILNTAIFFAIGAIIGLIIQKIRK